ncbi:SAM-dependent methyltransferase [Rhizohabitans arisaemae]|uniref:SAM-dependent methyltransferase n=1 Tax=Rhizohabitans arisaemae TaxID=2720610 RepID=UPI0024B1454B|nr:SAM-dependent methyltransferase [Rhizohabitans arisaemae]
MWLTWREAMQSALYGQGGFYLRERPDQHFRTSVHASTAFAGALVRVLTEVDAMLGRPDPFDLIDVGAGGGELLTGLVRGAPPEMRARLRPRGVEVAGRPEGLPETIEWATGPPESVTGLVVANEWLDNVPVDVVEQTRRGPRLVLVDPANGAERLGPAPEGADLDWLERWWPMAALGERAEIGRPRDEAWGALIGTIRDGVAITADYAHRLGGRPPGGTLASYRDGALVRAVPDGSCDITAHVALDACAAAGEAAGATATVLTTQREALRVLGVTGERPSIELARTDPRRYLAELVRAGEEAELIDPYGLGGFGWLRQDRISYLTYISHD